MPLTRDHLILLSAPFKPEEHEFKPPRGYVYIAETAICERIESIDPSWEWHIHSTTRNDSKGAIATTIGHLTILGVTRGGDGQQAVEFQKGTDIESGEAEKGSETDALKRAARKFGIGRYLLDCPKEVKGYGPDLNKWLASLGKKQAPQSETPAPAKSPASSPMNAGAAIAAVLPEYQAFMHDHRFESMKAELRGSIKTLAFITSAPQARTHIEKTYGIDIDLDTLYIVRKEAN